MAAFVFKVLTLTIRTASKPLASRFQSYVLSHPTLRPAVLNFAQGVHGLDFAMSRLAEGKPVGLSKRFVAKLDDERALDLAGKVVSEGFVLAVAVGIIGWEYNRNAVKDEQKKAKEEAFRESIDAGFQQCHQRLERQAQQMGALLEAMQGRQQALEAAVAALQEQQQQARAGGGWRLWGAGGS